MYYLVRGKDDNLEYFFFFDYTIGPRFTENKKQATKISENKKDASIYEKIIKTCNARFIHVD